VLPANDFGEIEMTTLTITIDITKLSDGEIARILHAYRTHVDNLGVRLAVEDYPNIRNKHNEDVGVITLTED
jgi:hypothetical protein